MMLAVALLGAVAASPVPELETRAYGGFGTLQNLFFFGDSYTASGFNVSGKQPSASNPLGNPSPPVTSSANGVWSTLLGTASGYTIPTFDLAWYGATVDPTISPPYTPSVHTIKQQVQQDWKPNYTGKKQTWNPDTTGFFVWGGQNDLNGAILASDRVNMTAAELTMNQTWTAYKNLLDEMYNAGARNFIVLGLSAVETVPELYGLSDDLRQWIIAQRGAWWARLSDWYWNRYKYWPGAAVAIYDPAAAQVSLLNNSTRLAQLGITQSQGFCQQYWSVNNAPQGYSDPACPVPLSQYFWLNNLHPTQVMHRVWADEVKARIS
ncbi:hypothetical protein PYCC9005_000705 [Savitreella phatthalungensis]